MTTTGKNTCFRGPWPREVAAAQGLVKQRLQLLAPDTIKAEQMPLLGGGWHSDIVSLCAADS